MARNGLRSPALWLILLAMVPLSGAFVISHSMDSRQRTSCLAVMTASPASSASPNKGRVGGVESPLLDRRGVLLAGVVAGGAIVYPKAAAAEVRLLRLPLSSATTLDLLPNLNPLLLHELELMIFTTVSGRGRHQGCDGRLEAHPGVYQGSRVGQVSQLLARLFISPRSVAADELVSPL